MAIKIGDGVRFLNAVGGGIVTRIDIKNRLVYVEDADGFEVPVLENECVVVPPVNESTNLPKRDFSAKTTVEQTKKVVEVQEEKVRPEEMQVVETAEGDELKVVLCFCPLDIKQLQTTSYECYLINDSNYFLYYNITAEKDGCCKPFFQGLIEPNMQEWLAEIQKIELNEWESTRVQIIPFKKDKTYPSQRVVDRKLNIQPVKFYKLHSFTENDYFEDPALLIDVTSSWNDKPIEYQTREIREALFSKSEPDSPKMLKMQPQQHRAGIIEVDLHIDELVDTTVGLSNGDMLRLQIDKFESVLKENSRKKGQKIVFIHGKGEGVLRNEIEKLLRTRYKMYFFQDASFREYGFGATMVTIK